MFSVPYNSFQLFFELYQQYRGRKLYEQLNEDEFNYVKRKDNVHSNSDMFNDLGSISRGGGILKCLLDQ